jgi:hypothetical protein
MLMYEYLSAWSALRSWKVIDMLLAKGRRVGDGLCDWVVERGWVCSEQMNTTLGGQAVKEVKLFLMSLWDSEIKDKDSL